MGPDPSVSAFC